MLGQPALARGVCVGNDGRRVGPLRHNIDRAMCRCFFFFQAEDGIRDVAVTGVQTCALPICSIREALRGSHQDFTVGNLNRAIILLAIPMVLEMVLESLFAVVDVFWVGRLGADAVATVGLTESLLSLVFAVGLGLSLSTTAMVARRIGEKDPKAAAVAGVQAIALGLTVSALVGIPCLVFAPELLRLMGASRQIVQVGSGYARIALGGSGAILLLFLNNAIFRGAGDAAIAMRLLWVSNIIDLVLDPCLIFGLGPFPKLGVTGAALATFTGRSIGVAYQFYRLLRGSKRDRKSTRLNS